MTSTTCSASTPGRWGFFLGDGCGKGVQAAALTSLARYTLRAVAHHRPDDPAAVLAALNDTLLAEPSAGGRFCTVLYGVLERAADGTVLVTLTGGGHPPARHLVPGREGVTGRPVELAGSTLVGVFGDPRFVTATVRLAPGSGLLLYTDGLTEARTRGGGQLGLISSFLVTRAPGTSFLGYPAGRGRGTVVAVANKAAGPFHEVGFYRSDAEFGALIVPFVEEGLAGGHPVIIAYDDRKASLLRSWVSDPGAVTFLAGGGLYSTPAGAIAAYWQLFERHAAAGATQIRIAGDVPHEGIGGRFAGWDCYESAINTIWGQFPVWSRCLYDAGTAAPRVLDIAQRTHPRIVLPSGLYQPSGRYQDPAVFEPLPPDPDPLERSVPALVLTDPSAFQTRHAVTSIGHGRLADTVLRDMVIGVSEAVSNAWRHGRPPVTVRIWTESGRMLVRVHDTGPGPGNPLAGLSPAWARPGLRGAGLWLIRRLGLDAALIRSRDGFTVRLAAGPA